MLPGRGTRVSQALSQPTWPAALAPHYYSVSSSDKGQQGSSLLQRRAHAVFFLPGVHGHTAGFRPLLKCHLLRKLLHLKFPHRILVLVFPSALTVEFHLPH